jgi:hypothetical protein
MDVLLTLLGLALLLLTLRDIFETLFHPLGRGRLGWWVAEGVSRSARRLAPGSTGDLIAGPLAYIAVIAFWTAMLAIGWALILLPHLPQGFNFAAGLEPGQHGELIDALYVSLVNLTSLGYGDISPQETGLRLLGPVETLFGLGLLTASISWLISIYSVISRRDALAHEVFLARQAEEELGEKLADADPELLERMLASFTDQLIAARRDLIHFPITQYFRTEDESRALSRLLPYLSRLAEEAAEGGRPRALNVRAAMLRMAMDDFAETLRTRLHLSGDTTEATLDAWQAR